MTNCWDTLKLGEPDPGPVRRSAHPTTTTRASGCYAVARPPGLPPVCFRSPFSSVSTDRLRFANIGRLSPRHRLKTASESPSPRISRPSCIALASHRSTSFARSRTFGMAASLPQELHSNSIHGNSIMIWDCVIQLGFIPHKNLTLHSIYFGVTDEHSNSVPGCQPS